MKTFVKSNYEKLVLLLLPLGAIAALAPSPNLALIAEAEEMQNEGPLTSRDIGQFACPPVSIIRPRNPETSINLNGERPLFGPSGKWTFSPNPNCWAANYGGGQLLIKKITPLHTRIRLRKVHAGSSSTRYRFEIETLESTDKPPRKTYATAGLARPDEQRGLSVK